MIVLFPVVNIGNTFLLAAPFCMSAFVLILLGLYLAVAAKPSILLFSGCRQASYSIVCAPVHFLAVAAMPAIP